MEPSRLYSLVLRFFQSILFVRFIHVVICSYSLFSLHKYITLFVYHFLLICWRSYKGIWTFAGGLCCKYRPLGLIFKISFIVSFEVEILNFKVGVFMNLYSVPLSLLCPLIKNAFPTPRSWRYSPNPLFHKSFVAFFVERYHSFIRLSKGSETFRLTFNIFILFHQRGENTQF